MATNMEEFVKLVNKTKKPISFVYDGASYTVDKNLRIKRFIAEHAIKKTYLLEKHEYQFEIQEFPESQRNPSDTFEVKGDSAELEALKLEIKTLKESAPNVNIEDASLYLKEKNKELKDLVRTLEDEVGNLKFEIKELKKK